jgi:hypothetical protein
VRPTASASKEDQAELDGACPQDAACSAQGLSQVMSILFVAGPRASDDFMRNTQSLPVQERSTLEDLKTANSSATHFGAA